MQSCLQLWPSPALRCAAKQRCCASWVQWRSVGGRGEWAVSWHLCGGWFYRVMIHFPKLPNCGFGKAGVRDDQTKSHGSCTIGTTGTGICETKMERCAEVVGNGHHQREAAGPRNNQVGLEVGIWWRVFFGRDQKCPNLELLEFLLKQLTFFWTNRFWKNLGLDPPHLCAFPTYIFTDAISI